MGIKLRKYFLVFLDILFLYFSLYLALLLRNFRKFETEIFFLHLFPFTILYFFWLIAFYTFGFYDFEFLKTSLIFKTISVTSLNFVLGVFLFYFVPQFKITPKTILILNSLIFGIFFFLLRKFSLSFFSAYLLEKVAILGKDNQVEKLKKEIKEKPFLGYEIVEIDPSGDIVAQIKKEKIKTIVFTEEFEKDPKFQNLFYNLLFLGVNF